MSKRYITMPLLCIFLGGVCLSLSPGYNSNNNRSSSRYPQDVKPGVSDDSRDSQQYRNQATGREEIAYMDERDEDIHQRANRMGDWGYRQNWRYDRKAFYKGETQGEAYNEEHPEGAGGIGMDPDTEYLQMHKFYQEESKREQQNRNANPSNNPYRTNPGNQNNAAKNNSGYPNNPASRQQNLDRSYPSTSNSSHPYYYEQERYPSNDSSYR